MTKLLTKTLFIASFSFLLGCGTNEVKDSPSTFVNPSQLLVKDGIVYNYGAQNEKPSKVAKIINKSIDTKIIEIDAEKVPHPLFGRTLDTFITAPGQRMLTIKYYDGGSYMSGAPMISAKVEEGKIYILTSNKQDRGISYSLRDLSNNKVINAPFIRQKH